MAVLALVCITLGIWQINRLAEKEAMIARVEMRIGTAPIPLPPFAEWQVLDAEVYDFQPVSLTGTFVPEETVMVFTNLAGARGAHDGVGYWVVTPMRLADGGTVLVNRGFVPENARQLFDSSAAAGVPEDIKTITGIARKQETANSFTPGPDIAGRIEYVRSIARMTAMMDPALAPFAPIYVNAAATGPGILPQGGETKIDFPNRHFEYAMTWFSLAGVIVVMTGIWLWRRSRI